MEPEGLLPHWQALITYPFLDPH